MGLAGLAAALLLFIAALAMFMYVVIMGPTRYHRDGVVGRIHRLLMDCPGMCCGCFCGLFFGCSYTRGRHKWQRCADHTLRERNCFMVVFYILLVWSVEFLYVAIALPHLEASVVSKFISCGLVGLSEWFYALSVLSDPGVITAVEGQAAHGRRATGSAGHNRPKTQEQTRHLNPEQGRRATGRAATVETNAKEEAAGVRDRGGGRKLGVSPLSPEAEARQNRKYAVDGILFGVGSHRVAGGRDGSNEPAAYPVKAVEVACVTCYVLRPSRSKHCRLCNYCVRRFDHHCPWINNDVAEGTHRWFLLFLLTHAVSCTWAAWDLFVIIKRFLLQSGVWGWTLRTSYGRVYHLSLLDYVAILVTYQTLSVCLLFFATVIGLMLWGFWAYQMSFVLCNLTTNDMMKIDDAVEKLTSLPSLDVVYREALNVRLQLEAVAAKPPRALQKKLLPPLQDVVPRSKADRAYRNNVRKLLLHDLKGMFDRGVWNNLMEVMFPYN